MTSLLAPVIACHHWISVTASAGEAPNASVVATSAAAPNCRKAIKTLPLDRHSDSRAVSAPDDVHMTVSGRDGTGQAGAKGSPNREEGGRNLAPAGPLSALALAAANHAARNQRVDLALCIAELAQHFLRVLAEFRRRAAQARLAPLHPDRRGDAL